LIVSFADEFVGDDVRYISVPNPDSGGASEVDLLLQLATPIAEYLYQANSI